jgi:hypothetical protein
MLKDVLFSQYMDKFQKFVSEIAKLPIRMGSV